MGKPVFASKPDNPARVRGSASTMSKRTIGAASGLLGTAVGVSFPTVSRNRGNGLDEY
jgi:hypothetical protein